MENNKKKIKVNTTILKCKRKEDLIKFGREFCMNFINFIMILFRFTAWTRRKIIYPIYMKRKM